MIGSSFEEDEDIQAALSWFATVSGNPQGFFERLARAQQEYRTLTETPANLGQDLGLERISQDVVGAFLAQAKSLLDDRRSYDVALASQIVPWVKQIGRNINVIPHIPGAIERATRMLKEESVAPDSAMFELVMASNYATWGFGVAFIKEAPGQVKTPDLRLLASSSSKPIFVECKRLRRGEYEISERAKHKKQFSKTAELICVCALSVHLDVTYTKELGEVADSYLADILMRALTSSIANLEGYSWKDEFGFGVVKPADLVTARRDIHHNGPVYFGPKLARLLCGHVVRENGYQLAVGADPDERDPRFIDTIHYGSVVTWQCIAPDAIQKKARYVKAKLSEADRQLSTHGSGIVHLAMDMELQCESSDLRRARNTDAITAFRPCSNLIAIYVHYLVQRISESNPWMIDETVDRFGVDELVPPLIIFTAASAVGNDLPAWKQKI